MPGPGLFSSVMYHVIPPARLKSPSLESVTPTSGGIPRVSLIVTEKGVKINEF
jgi:hypothetical protein